MTLYKFLILAILNILDAITTLCVVANGGIELNPLMAAALDHSMWTFVIIKLSASIFITVSGFIINGSAKNHRATNIMLNFVIGLYLFIVFWNSYLCLSIL